MIPRWYQSQNCSFDSILHLISWRVLSVPLFIDVFILNLLTGNSMWTWWWTTSWINQLRNSTRSSWKGFTVFVLGRCWWYVQPTCSLIQCILQYKVNWIDFKAIQFSPRQSNFHSLSNASLVRGEMMLLFPHPQTSLLSFMHTRLLPPVPSKQWFFIHFDSISLTIYREFYGRMN